MFFKRQECTGRWISVESEAVCKTAKIQTEMTYFLRDGCSTRGHTLGHGSQYKLESKSETYCAPKARQSNRHHLPPKSNHSCEQQKESFKSSLRHHLPICPSSLSNTGKKENSPTLGSMKPLLTLSVA